MAAPRDLDLDTQINLETEEELFSEFRFQSFRTHKLIEEDYSLL